MNSCMLRTCRYCSEQGHCLSDEEYRICLATSRLVLCIPQDGDMETIEEYERQRRVQDETDE